MKKTTLSISLALLLLPAFAYAEDSATSSLAIGTTSVQTEATTTPLPTFTSCSQEAIEKRDTSIAASRSAYNVTMTNALNERKNREKAAIALTDEGDKKDAIKVSVDTYKTQVRTAQNTLTQTRKALWQDFENDINKCRELEDVPAAKTLPSGERSAAKTMMLKTGEQQETKTIKETIKDKIETFFSIFN